MAPVDDNPILVTKQFTSTFTYDEYNKLWDKVKEKLDELGPKKDIKGWQKYLTDQKSRVKKKKAEVVLSSRKTGGGEDDVPDLLPAKEKLLSVMGGRSIVDGDEDVNEFGLGKVSLSAADYIDCIEEEEANERDMDAFLFGSDNSAVTKINRNVIFRSTQPKVPMPSCSGTGDCPTSKNTPNEWKNWAAFVEDVNSNISTSKLRENLKLRSNLKARELSCGTTTTNANTEPIKPRNRKRKMTEGEYLGLEIDF